MTARWAIGAVLFVAFYFYAVIRFATKEYRPMSDRLYRSLRTFVAAFAGSLVPVVAGKLLAIKSISELSGLASTLTPFVVASASAAFTAALHVLFPPKAPPAA